LSSAPLRVEAAKDDASGEGVAMVRLIEELYPICRSITGEGLRQSLRLIARHVPLALREIPTGTQVFDWIIPKEWNVRGAFIATADGRRIVDFADSNLHLVQYSVPLDRIVGRDELLAHIHTMPERPAWIPYRTSYYTEGWGFCLSERQARTLTDPAYRVVIDATLAQGHLTYGELEVKGASADEVLFSCHSCHPSLANDNLSGMAVATMLARRLMAAPRRLTYRFLFIPGTIGSLAWLAANEARVPRVKHGLVLSCVGDQGAFTYKQSRRGNAEIDRILAHVLRHGGAPHRILPFIPYGYDERQYCSPGFDMPVGCFMRSPNGSYPEYHTSADDLSLVRPECLAQSLDMLWQVVGAIEANATYVSRNPKGEPQLGRRGLYRPMGGHQAQDFDQMSLLWVLNLADGRHSLLDMAERSQLPFATISAAADALAAAELIAPAAASARKD
jgi:aminopeptidase-like protein